MSLVSGWREKFDFGLTDPPYKVRYKRNINEACCNIITPEYMSELVDLECNFKAAGVHGLVFCL